MSPSSEHEQLKDEITSLVNVVAEEMNIDVHGPGSTTFRREDLARGFEPDSCFYVEHTARMRGKTELDLHVDPPPDLIIEIDITSPSISKFPIFAQLAVPEVWRYDGKRWTILTLHEGAYVEQPQSIALPVLTADAIGHFLQAGQMLPRPAWWRQVREWVRQQ